MSTSPEVAIYRIRHKAGHILEMLFDPMERVYEEIMFIGNGRFLRELVGTPVKPCG